MSLDQLAKESAIQFRQRFGGSPHWLVAAPGRVNLIGEHTDYNDGFVLPMAIERWTVIAASPNPARRAMIQSVATDSTVEIDLSRPIEPTSHDWTSYIRGVLAGFQQAGFALNGFDALIHSSVPLGSGLSSSAALEVACATLLEAVTQQNLDPVDKALLCQRAEHQFAGVPCGIMDQFTSTLARQDNLLLLDCRSHAFELVPMTDDSLAILIINTNVRHALAGGEYAERRRQCETAARALKVRALRDANLDKLTTAAAEMPSVPWRRARHVITEIERTLATARAIAASDWPTVGDLMYASHESLRTDYEVSCQELDAVVEIAREIGSAGGLLGCRMTGGGFGGCAVSLVRTGAVPEIMRRMDEEYRQRTGIEATMFVSRAADGARSLAVP